MSEKIAVGLGSAAGGIEFGSQLLAVAMLEVSEEVAEPVVVASEVSLAPAVEDVMVSESLVELRLVLLVELILVVVELRKGGSGDEIVERVLERELGMVLKLESDETDVAVVSVLDASSEAVDTEASGTLDDETSEVLDVAAEALDEPVSEPPDVDAIESLESLLVGLLLVLSWELTPGDVEDEPNEDSDAPEDWLADDAISVPLTVVKSGPIVSEP